MGITSTLNGLTFTVASLAFVTIGLLGWNIGLQIQVSNTANKLPSTFAYMPVAHWSELAVLTSSTSPGYNSSENINTGQLLFIIAMRGQEYVSGNSTAELIVFASLTVDSVGPPETVYSLTIAIPSNMHGIVIDPQTQLPLVFAGSTDVTAFSFESKITSPFPNGLKIQTRLPVGVVAQTFSSNPIAVTIGNFDPLTVAA